MELLIAGGKFVRFPNRKKLSLKQFYVLSKSKTKQKKSLIFEAAKMKTEQEFGGYLKQTEEVQW